MAIITGIFGIYIFNTLTFEPIHVLNFESAFT